MRFPELAVVALSLATGACNGCGRVPEPASTSAETTPAQTSSKAATTAASILGKQPHDRAAFTQGLVYADGVFYESTGLYGQSSLRRVEPETGRVLKAVSLDASLFGEGLSLLHGELYQLTWREHRCLVYDATTFAKVREATYDGEGWGLTNDGDSTLIMSDGSDTLRFLEPQTFRVLRTVKVRDGARAIDRLNELEWVRGEVLANVWGDDVIARIDPATGSVRGFIDLSAAPEPQREDRDAVLNGIAFDASSGRLYVTGKLWSSIFEITPPQE